jgi:hypothetical protein
MGILTNSIHTIVRGNQVITTGGGDMWVSGLEYSGGRITGYSGSAFNGCECDSGAIVDSAYDITTAWVAEQGYLTAHQDLTGLPYVQNSALENTTIFDTDLISGISGTGLFAQSASGAFNADHANTADHANSASLAESALSAGTASNSNSAVSSLYAMNVVSGWEYNQNNEITAYNGSAIAIPDQIEYSAGDNIDINDYTISLSDVVAIKSHEGEPLSGSIAFGNIVHWGQQDYAPGWAIEAYTDSGRGYHSYNTCDIGLQAFYWGDYAHDRDTNSVSGESHLLIYEGDIKYQSGTFQKVNNLPVIWSITGIKADTDDVRNTVSANSATWGSGNDNLGFASAPGEADLSNATASIVNKINRYQLNISNTYGNAASFTMIPTGISDGFLYASGANISAKSIDLPTCSAYDIDVGEDGINFAIPDYINQFTFTTPTNDEYHGGSPTYRVKVNGLQMNVASGAYVTLFRMRTYIGGDTTEWRFISGNGLAVW